MSDLQHLVGQSSVDGPRRPRLRDIAREAGVGVATAERVLNGRPNVLPKTAKRVIVAARKLGYDRTLPSLHHACIRVEVVLVRPETEFFARLNLEFERIGASLDKSIVLHRSVLKDESVEAIAHHVLQATQHRTAAIVVAQDHPAIVAALRAADAKRVPLVLLVSDVRYGGDAVYVGIDNESAGRTAGYFMRHLLGGRRGRIIALCHSGAYLVHRQRMLGFSRYFRDPEDDLRFTACLLARDSDDMAHDVLRQMLRQHDDVVGVYAAGGGHLGVDRALRDAGRAGDIVYIGHELSPGTRRSLAEGSMALTIDQAPDLQVRRAVEVLETLIGLRGGVPDRSPISFRIITPENLDN